MILSHLLPVPGEHTVFLQWDILLLYLSSGPWPLGSFHLTPGLPTWLSSKESACQGRRHGFNPWVAKIPWRRKWKSPPVFLPGKYHGQRSLDGYNICGRRARHYLMTEQHLTQVYYFPRAVRAKYHKPSDLKQQKLLSHNSGSWKSTWRFRHGHIRKNPSFPLSSFWWFAVNLWRSLACCCVTCLAFIVTWCSPCVSLCLHIAFFL